MKPFKLIYYIFTIIIAAIALLLVVSIFPITGNFKVLTVLSGSMEPAIHTGSIVVVKPAKDYKINDIVTFGPNTRTKTPTTHRIFDIRVENGNPIYITKGDANDGPDAKEIQPREIIGKVLFSVPYAGYAVDTAKKPYGFVSIIVLPAMIIIIDEVWKIKGEIARLRRKKKEEKKDEVIG